MLSYIALLRGVNVGGKTISMEKLRQLLSSLGFLNVRTYIQSGNVLFEHSTRNVSELSRLIETKILRQLGVDTTVVLRTKSQLEKVVLNNPYRSKDERWVHVVFLSDRPGTIPKNVVDGVVSPGEAFTISDSEVYLFLPNGMGRTKLSNSFFEKTLKVKATTRNLRTTRTLLSMSQSPEASV